MYVPCFTESYYVMTADCKVEVTIFKSNFYVSPWNVGSLSNTGSSDDEGSGDGYPRYWSSSDSQLEATEGESIGGIYQQPGGLA